MKTSWVGAAVLAILIGSCFGVAGYRRRNVMPMQVRCMAMTMGWHGGQSIAEIGAGDGEMALFAAEKVGPGGHVYANEIDPEELVRIKARAGKRGLANVSVVAGIETDANLPANCCDVVFMRWVYHHFTHPDDMDRSVYRALRPNGLLAIADFSPDPLDRLIAWVRHHGLDGLPRETIIRQVVAAGFTLDGDVEGWPGKGYCLLFRKFN